MDAFALVIFGSVAAVVICLLLIGRYYPGNGLEQIGQRTARQITETRERLEAEDLQQMLAAHNARRRASGRAELTEAQLEMQVADGFREQQRRREELLAESELDQLLEATNARRRARGLPERSRETVRREFDSPSPGAEA